MPTQNRVDYVKTRTRKEFKSAKRVTDVHQIDLLMVVGLTNLESVEVSVCLLIIYINLVGLTFCTQVQAKHLTEVFNFDWKAAYDKQSDQTRINKAMEDLPV